LLRKRGRLDLGQNDNSGAGIVFNASHILLVFQKVVLQVPVRVCAVNEKGHDVCELVTDTSFVNHLFSI